MLTTRENFLATLKGEKADRFVNQYEFMEIITDPVMFDIGGMPFTMAPGTTQVSKWGVTNIWPEDCPGPMPLNNPETNVITDIEEWRSQIKVPEVLLPDEAWAPAEKQISEVNRDEKLIAAFIAPGIFEKIHYLCGMEDAMVNLITDPEPMHELIDFMVEWELKLADEQIRHLHPEILLHHDDLGSHNSTFFSAEMFEEFFVPAYKKVYGFYKEDGCIIVHHSDSYAANLVPAMIDMGVDIWQGCTNTNNIPALISQYGDKLCFMGSINSADVDTPDWTPEKVRAVVERECRANGTSHFIPCHIQGAPVTVHPGVYDCITKEIDRMSREMF